MPDFNYKNKSATTPANGKTPASNGNFKRNSPNYATMPASLSNSALKKSTSNESAKVDDDRPSSADAGCKSSSDKDEDNSKIGDISATVAENEGSVNDLKPEETKVAEAETTVTSEDAEDDVSRPIDKNDVD